MKININMNKDIIEEILQYVDCETYINVKKFF